ncbi:MAG: hypothetical protein D6732_00910 [Methanobacteriota archaeon]|nr:MAG: hypothetical protein D6732_00910 [Euryarchaeota archaeon]
MGFKSRKSISPIIAIGLMIALALFGGATVAILLSQTGDTVPQPISALNASAANNLILARAEIVQVTEYPDPLISEDVIGIEVEVTNLGLTSFFIQDVDVVVGSTRLDDFADWTIQETTGAIKVNTNGLPFQPGDDFGGYMQSPGSISYFVELDPSDYDNAFARIPFDAPLFFANVKIGNLPAQTDEIVPSQSVALRDFYSPVGYRVALFHHGAETASSRSDLEKMFTDSRFKGLTSSKNMNISFDPAIDEYDFSSPTHGINATQIANDYDVVLVAMWAVHKNIANELTELFNKGVALVFYGSLVDFGNYNQIVAEINQTATEQIAGITFEGCSTCDNVKPKETKANNTYWFEPQTKPGIVADLLPYSVFFEDKKRKDLFGYDIANVTQNPLIPTKVYGYHRYELRDKGNNNALFLNVTSPLLVVRETASNKKVVSFIMNHESMVKKKPNDHRYLVPRNLLFAALGEDRKLIRHTKVVMESFTLTQNPSNTQEFRISFQAQITEGDINLKNGGLNFTLYLPTDYTIDFRRGKEKKVQVDVETSGSTRTYTKTIKIDIQPNNIIHIDVGGNISKGKRGLLYLYRNDNLTLTLPVRGTNRLRWLQLAPSDDPTQVKPWTVVANWTNVDLSRDTLSTTYDMAIQPVFKGNMRSDFSITTIEKRKQYLPEIITRINL